MDVEKALLKCQAYLDHSSWKNAMLEDISLETLTGGLTNKLYICTNKKSDSSPCKVLIREYQMDLSDVCPREQEVLVFALLADRNIAPPLYGVWPEGRLEGYIENSRPLSTLELSEPINIEQIGTRMGEIHSVNLPIVKQRNWLDQLFQKWLRKALDLLRNPQSIKDERKIKLLTEINNSRNLVDDVQWVISTLEAHPDMDVVFCHNDGQELNALKLPNGEIQMIDFEYSSYNFAAYDIANCFCEWTYGYDAPEYPYFWSNHTYYPTEDQQHEFVKAYLVAKDKTKSLCNPTELECEIQRMLHHVQICSCMPHLLWALWGIVNCTCNIDYGYLEFSQARFIDFDKLRKMSES